MFPFELVTVSLTSLFGTLIVRSNDPWSSRSFGESIKEIDGERERERMNKDPSTVYYCISNGRSYEFFPTSSSYIVDCR